jgi:phosphomannomutase
MNLAAFKAYHVRGRIPDEINQDLVRAIGKSYAALVKRKQVVVGRDICLTSGVLAEALIEGLLQSGVSVADIGLGGTERVYRAAAKASREQSGFDGGILVTATHSLPNCNGMQLVREGARPIRSDIGL